MGLNLIIWMWLSWLWTFECSGLFLGQWFLHFCLPACPATLIFNACKMLVYVYQGKRFIGWSCNTIIDTWYVKLSSNIYVYLRRGRSTIEHRYKILAKTCETGHNVLAKKDASHLRHLRCKVLARTSHLRRPGQAFYVLLYFCPFVPDMMQNLETDMFHETAHGNLCAMSDLMYSTLSDYFIKATNTPLISNFAL